MPLRNPLFDPIFYAAALKRMSEEAAKIIAEAKARPRPPRGRDARRADDDPQFDYDKHRFPYADNWWS